MSDTEIRAIHEKLDMILVILQGNGNPASGLVTKHELLTQSYEQLNDSVQACQAQHTAEQAEAKTDVRWWIMAVVAAGAVVVAWLK